MTKNSLIFVFLTFFLASCSNNSKEDMGNLIPFYESCLDYIDRYKEIAWERYKVKIRITYFNANKRYQAHPGLIGVLSLSGKNTKDSLRVIENGIELVCFPIHSLNTGNDELGRKIIFDDLKHGKFTRNQEKYLVVSD